METSDQELTEPVQPDSNGESPYAHLDLPPTPQFVIVGAQKSGTRYLRFNLGLHPDIHTCDEELSFFVHRSKWTTGVDGYRSLFTGWDGETFVGEATPGYMMWRHEPNRMAKRMKAALPDIKPIAVLRNPVDRAYSAFIHHLKRNRVKPTDDFVELVTRPNAKTQRYGLLEGGWYASSLRPYHQRFGEDLTVVLNDDLTEDPAGVYRSVLELIGADTGFLPESISERLFANTPSRDTGLRKKEGSGYRPLDLEQRQALYPFYAKEMKALSRMIGRDLSMWEPDTAPSAAPVPPKGGFARAFDEAIPGGTASALLDESNKSTREHARYFGLKTLTAPNDLMTYLQLIEERRPERVLLIGDGHGGLTLALAHGIAGIGEGRLGLVSVPALLPDALGNHELVSVFDAEAEDLEAQLDAELAEATTMVIISGDWRPSTKRGSIERYSGRVSPGFHLVVEHTARMRGLGKDEPLPELADDPVRQLVESGQDFEIDPAADHHLATMNPGGVLLRVG